MGTVNPAPFQFNIAQKNIACLKRKKNIIFWFLHIGAVDIPAETNCKFIYRQTNVRQYRGTLPLRRYGMEKKPGYLWYKRIYFFAHAGWVIFEADLYFGIKVIALHILESAKRRRESLLWVYLLVIPVGTA